MGDPFRMREEFADYEPWRGHPMVWAAAREKVLGEKGTTQEKKRQGRRGVIEAFFF